MGNMSPLPPFVQKKELEEVETSSIMFTDTSDRCHYLFHLLSTSSELAGEYSGEFKLS